MPQMAPISWLLLFMIFTITMIIFNVKNYYCFFYNNNNISQSLNIKKIQMNWKW
uniref:ATP synthase complex subunit 8 n=1 Tax=Mansonia amazonensis TaxID=2597065 RepID=A0A5B9H8H0_9DIPT|nr:ATP synthase F0 subunit 8 [Mansonia amazonensis]QEE94336.1 ATP synthase F0 subunit 8 [Mansonia amazonensis]